MDFKKLISKLDGIESPEKTPQAPSLPKSVQLNEEAQLRVLAGQTTVLAESELMEKKMVADKKAKKDEPVKEAEDRPDAKKTSGETSLPSGAKVKTTKVKGWQSLKADKDAEKNESIDVSKFKNKFNSMVEAAKSKPDFLDMDKDGDKKEPMKKAVADKKKGAVKEAMKVGDKKPSSTGGTIEKTKTGVKHTAGKNYSGKGAEKEKPVKEADERAAAKKTERETTLPSGAKVKATKVQGWQSQKADKDAEKNESAMMPKGKKRPVKESVEKKLSFKEMIKLVQESGGQQAIDPIDKELFAWATRVAQTKFNESMKAEVYAGLVYERMGGVFEMYDVLNETKK